MSVFARGGHILAKDQWEELWDKGEKKPLNLEAADLGLNSRSVIRVNIITLFNSRAALYYPLKGGISPVLSTALSHQSPKPSTSPSGMKPLSL